MFQSSELICFKINIFSFKGQNKVILYKHTIILTETFETIAEI